MLHNPTLLNGFGEHQGNVLNAKRALKRLKDRALSLSGLFLFGTHREMMLMSHTWSQTRNPATFWGVTVLATASLHYIYPFLQLHYYYLS